VADALTACAERNYEKVSKSPKHPQADTAAARLLEIWEHKTYSDDEKLVRKYKKKLKGLQVRYPHVEAAEHPPRVEPEAGGPK
jgi:hypothetical protein